MRPRPPPPRQQRERGAGKLSGFEEEVEEKKTFFCCFQDSACFVAPLFRQNLLRLSPRRSSFILLSREKREPALVETTTKNKEKRVFIFCLCATTQRSRTPILSSSFPFKKKS